MSLLRRTGEELFGEITEPVMMKLGTAMATALERIAGILKAGQRPGVFDEVDTDYLANHLYTQTLGSLHMARVGLIVSSGQPGHPVVHHADIATVRETAITATLATAVGRNAFAGTPGSVPTRSATNGRPAPPQTAKPARPSRPPPGAPPHEEQERHRDRDPARWPLSPATGSPSPGRTRPTGTPPTPTCSPPPSTGLVDRTGLGGERARRGRRRRGAQARARLEPDPRGASSDRKLAADDPGVRHPAGLRHRAGGGDPGRQQDRARPDRGRDRGRGRHRLRRAGRGQRRPARVLLDLNRATTPAGRG